MQTLPKDVLTLILQMVASECTTVCSLVSLRRLCRSLRNGIDDERVWTSWGGRAFALRTKDVEVGWMRCCWEIGQTDHDVDMGNMDRIAESTLEEVVTVDWERRVAEDASKLVRRLLAQNGRFSLFLYPPESGARRMCLEKSSVCIGMWSTAGNYRILDACISSDGLRVGWVSKKEDYFKSYLSCVDIRTQRPWTVAKLKRERLMGIVGDRNHYFILNREDAFVVCNDAGAPVNSIAHSRDLPWEPRYTGRGFQVCTPRGNKVVIFDLQLATEVALIEGEEPNPRETQEMLVASLGGTRTCLVQVLPRMSKLVFWSNLGTFLGDIELANYRALYGADVRILRDFSGLVCLEDCGVLDVLEFH